MFCKVERFIRPQFYVFCASHNKVIEQQDKLNFQLPLFCALKQHANLYFACRRRGYHALDLAQKHNFLFV